MTIPEPGGQDLISTVVQGSSNSPPNISLEHSTSRARTRAGNVFGRLSRELRREDVDLAWTLKIDGYL